MPRIIPEIPNDTPDKKTKEKSVTQKDISNTHRTPKGADILPCSPKRALTDPPIEECNNGLDEDNLLFDDNKNFKDRFGNQKQNKTPPQPLPDEDSEEGDP